MYGLYMMLIKCGIFEYAYGSRLSTVKFHVVYRAPIVFEFVSIFLVGIIKKILIFSNFIENILDFVMQFQKATVIFSFFLYNKKFE
jgi:hypothetical protein